jgi:hypothetical protein
VGALAVAVHLNAGEIGGGAVAPLLN